MSDYLSNPVQFSQAEKKPLHLPGAAGLDEAGRGCLAGPVVAACVFLPRQAGKLTSLEGLTDSKQLAPPIRARLEPEIKKIALGWSLGFVWPDEIDRINILQASLKAMSLAYASMRFRMLPGAETPVSLLLDGNRNLPASALLAALAQWGFGPEALLPRQAVIKGDAKILAIAAASVLAKTARDRFMLAADKKYPAYGFQRHKGYATKEHLDAVSRHGPCPLHRLSFRGSTQGIPQAPAAMLPV